MKNYLENIEKKAKIWLNIYMIIGSAVIYLLFAFIELDINFVNWNIGDRIAFVFLFTIFNVIMLIHRSSVIESILNKAKLKG